MNQTQEIHDDHNYYFYAGVFIIPNRNIVSRKTLTLKSFPFS